MAQIVSLYDLGPGLPRLVLAHGCFDVLHVGHVRHLRAARALGDFLAVTITPDRFVGKPGRPVFPESARLEMLAALWFVDFAALAPGPDAISVIDHLRPAVYIKGREYRDRMTAALLAEKTAVEDHGGRLAFTDTDDAHTSDILLRLGNPSATRPQGVLDGRTGKPLALGASVAYATWADEW